jgi:outer membrane lipoprotein-sorting protein
MMESRVMAFRAALILLVVVLQGCVTTITRVEQHQALFDSLDDAT